jgi:hypothetical protein
MNGAQQQQSIRYRGQYEQTVAEAYCTHLLLPYASALASHVDKHNA